MISLLFGSFIFWVLIVAVAVGLVLWLESKDEVQTPDTAPEDTFLSINPTKNVIDWEQFTGVKLFNWIGGFSLFLGAIFFAKYSIEHGLVSPLLRVLIGLLTGAGAVGSSLSLQKRGYLVTGQTLAAAGCSILYADIFAAHSLYHFLTAGQTFALLSLVTALAILLAVRLDSRYVALLGLVGGFLVPPLLSTGVDRPFGLFAYISLLDLGLILVAVRQRWAFLWALAALGTILILS